MKRVAHVNIMPSPVPAPEKNGFCRARTAVVSNLVLRPVLLPPFGVVTGTSALYCRMSLSYRGGIVATWMRGRYRGGDVGSCGDE